MRTLTDGSCKPRLLQPQFQRIGLDVDLDRPSTESLDRGDLGTADEGSHIDGSIHPIERQILLKRFPDSISISARTGDGLDVLTARIADRLTKKLIDVDVEIPQSEGTLLAELSTWSVPVKREYVDSPVKMTLRVPSRALYKL